MYKRIYVLRFPKSIVDQPIVCELVRKFDISFNILKATVLPLQAGLMVLELHGHKKNIDNGLKYLADLGVMIESMATEIQRDDTRCYQCGACTSTCPTGALHIRRSDMAVLFSPDLCTGCGFCVAVCPARAMKVSLNGTAKFPD